MTAHQPYPEIDPAIAEGLDAIVWPLDVVIDAHTRAIDPHFLETTCPECAVVVPSPGFDGHVGERHGHEPS